MVVFGEDTLVAGDEVVVGELGLGTRGSIAAEVDNVKEWGVECLDESCISEIEYVNESKMKAGQWGKRKGDICSASWYTIGRE